MTGGKGSIGAYLVSGYALAMLLNVIFPHLLATLVMRRYAPGTATAIVLNLPITFMLLYQGLEANFIDISVFVYVGVGPLVVVGILFFIPGLFFMGRRWLKP
ncbi:MAG: HXXEE domain-containing protein [Chloroflexi bacterium]|nr:HXXEE domain-containing protein [Chloroflexota bacterium]